MGCSPIKAVRELGSERRETVNSVAVYKFGYMLENPCIPHYSYRAISDRGALYSENVSGADNQQERLDGYISGYVDGEGCFAVAVNRNPTCRSGYQLVPEFHVSQNGDRAQVLRSDSRAVRRKRLHQVQRNGKIVLWSTSSDDDSDLLEHVIPFFERSPLLSSKHEDFEKFATIVRSMALGHTARLDGFSRLLDEALSMNGGGRFRSVRWRELIGSDPESSETVRRTRRVMPS